METSKTVLTFKGIKLKDSMIIAKDDMWGDCEGLLFNDKKPQKSQTEKWHFVDKDIKKVSQKLTRIINQRYELAADFLSRESILNGGMKKIYLLSEVGKDGDHASWFEKIKSLYEYKSDSEEYEVLYDFKINILATIEKLPTDVELAYEVYERSLWNEKNLLKKYNDEIYFIDTRALLPEPLRPGAPCIMSSGELYKIIRAHIIKKLDGRYAKITSDYDFCFAVQKVFNNKVQFTVFEMTPDNEKYKGYTPIGSISAPNKIALKKKIDSLLRHLITVINKPLSACSCCGGKGYLDQDKIKIGEIK